LSSENRKKPRADDLGRPLGGTTTSPGEGLPRVGQKTTEKKVLLSTVLSRNADGGTGAKKKKGNQEGIQGRFRPPKTKQRAGDWT